MILAKIDRDRIIVTKLNVGYGFTVRKMRS